MIQEQNNEYLYCSLPPIPEPVFPEDFDPNRKRAILTHSNKWANETVLHYCFLGTSPENDKKLEEDKNIVREAFNIWKNVGIGLKFKEVFSPSEAEIRISFLYDGKSWSYVGTQILHAIKGDDFPSGTIVTTMNFGWPLQGTQGLDLALHEIGHTLGFEHEHQNPKNGIEWCETAVYEYFEGKPNYWDKDSIQWNILRKIDVDDQQTQASPWDNNSIMHYRFEKGLILKPEDFRDGLIPEPGLSHWDKSKVKELYKPLTDEKYNTLNVNEYVPLSIEPGQQMHFIIQPQYTNKYNIRVSGNSDVLIVLFLNENGDNKYLMADNNICVQKDAQLETRLEKDKKYILGVLLTFTETPSTPGMVSMSEAKSKKNRMYFSGL